jgi:hypothetical protein
MNKATVKLEHIATGYQQIIPINHLEFNLLTSKYNMDWGSDRAFDCMRSRGVIDDDVFDHFFFEGVYLDGQLRSH